MAMTSIYCAKLADSHIRSKRVFASMEVVSFTCKRVDSLKSQQNVI